MKLQKNMLKLPRNLLLSIPLIALFLALPPFIDPYVMHVLVVCFWYATLATTYNIVSGYAGQISFAQSALSLIGGYTAGILTVYFKFPTTLTLIVGGFTALAVGIGIAMLTLRVRGPYFILCTITLGNMVIIVVQNEWEWTRGVMGLRVPPIAGITSTNFYYYLMFTIMVAMIFVLYKIERSSFGLSLNAIRDDEDAASAMGINTLRQKVLAFTIASFFAGVCGAFYAHYMRLCHPDQGDLNQMLIIMASSIIGGSGTLLGPVIGAFIYEILWELMRPLAASVFLGLHLVVFSVILLVVVRVAPSGIWGLITKIKERVSEVKT